MFMDDLYKVFSLLWSLKEDNEGDNIKTLRNLEVKLPGITDAFPLKNQYSLKRGIINISNISRIYPTGDVVAKSLPAAYQLGNSQINSIDNPNVPNNQYCGNCIFNQNNLTAAHKTLPLPSAVKVTNLENGLSIIVRINDRGPFVNQRIIDLSAKAAEKIQLKQKGTGLVRVQLLRSESLLLEKLAKKGKFPEIHEIKNKSF